MAINAVQLTRYLSVVKRFNTACRCLPSCSATAPRTSAIEHAVDALGVVHGLDVERAYHSTGLPGLDQQGAASGFAQVINIGFESLGDSWTASPMRPRTFARYRSLQSIPVLQGPYRDQR